MGTHPVSCLPVCFCFFLHLSIGHYSEFHPKVIPEPHLRGWEQSASCQRKARATGKMMVQYKEHGTFTVLPVLQNGHGARWKELGVRWTWLWVSALSPEWPSALWSWASFLNFLNLSIIEVFKYLIGGFWEFVKKCYTESDTQWALYIR